MRPPGWSWKSGASASSARPGAYGEALGELEPLLAQFPENRDALYLQAMNLRYLSRFEEALAVLERLQQLHPRYSRLYQERGHCRVALRDAPGAIDAFLRGVNLNPALPVSWDMLQRLYRMAGDAQNAATAAGHIADAAQPAARGGRGHQPVLRR